MASKRLLSAIEFAYEKHQNQKDKAGKPYFFHPLRVMFAVEYLGENAMIAAILHDVIEDCGVTVEYIAEHWGAEVAFAVNSVSRITFPFKETYMNLIERASQNEIGLEVKLADVEDNSKPERIEALPPESRDIVKRYDRAKKVLLTVKRHKQMLIDGGGA
jgi:GTP diphosphokinase / guanosine-3',5'-bis(diphosphate) 3'-diphosphatase